MQLDQDKVAQMIGKVVLAAVNYYEGPGELVEQRQVFGVVQRINLVEGVVLQSALDGREVSLPPLLDRYQKAEPGSYTLTAARVTVENPDYICAWDIPRTRQ